MSSVQLLDKTRMIQKLLHNNSSSKVVFNDICDVLKDILESNVLVISKKGKILGTGAREDIGEIEGLLKYEVGGIIDHMLNERLLGVLSTKDTFPIGNPFGKTPPKPDVTTMSPTLIVWSVLM